MFKFAATISPPRQVLHWRVGGRVTQVTQSAPSHLQSVVSLFSCRGSGSRYATELDAAKQESALLQEELDDMRLLNTALLKDLRQRMTA